MITVRQITKKKDFKKFVKFPDKLYKGNMNYVPPFEQDELDLTNPKKNACFEESEAAYFLAEEDGKVVGRISGIISHAYNKKNNTSYKFITKSFHNFFSSLVSGNNTKPITIAIIACQ